MVFSLKTPWADGITSLLLRPTELTEKLATLVPPPHLNLIRYHGILAPAARDRDQILPGPSELTDVLTEEENDEAGTDHRTRRHAFRVGLPPGQGLLW